MSVDVTVVDVPERQRFEALVGTDRVGFAAYQRTGNLIVFTHTEVDRVFEGHGVGGALVQYALDSVRAEGTHSVLPVCPFVVGFIGQHSEYRDIVFAPRRATVTD
jgi:predicted GNAT family acetyltransferase